MNFKNRPSLMAVALMATLATLAFGAPPVVQDDAHIERISVDELILMLAKKKPVTIIDVRTLDSYDSKIKGALQIPVDETEARLKDIPRTAEIVTYCA